MEKHDLNIKFVGAFSTTKQSAFVGAINEKSDVLTNPEVTFFTVASDTEYNGDSQDAALQFRMQFTSGALDVIFIDQENFDVYKKEPVFLDLSDFLDAHKDLPGIDTLILHEYTYTNEFGQEISGVYGIEFTEFGGQYFKEMPFGWLNDYFEDQNRSMILTLCRMGKNQALAESYLLEILQSVL